MSALRQTRISWAFVGAGLLVLAACKPARQAPPSVEELMEDRVELDGIMMKCNDPSTRDKAGASCEVARIAVERLAKQTEAAEAARRQQEFERNREKLRLTDAQRAAQQSAQKTVDPYTMPVVPVEPPSAPASAAAAQ
ncbi:MAG: hypothetical protein ACHQIL_04410 [Steroidobacterales bacterium]